MSATTIVAEELDAETGEITMKKQSGDYVVCNLSSINLARSVQDNVMDKVIPIAVRMLDNVIDVNLFPLKQAEFTSKRYRPVGLGTYGMAHLFALKKIHWDDERAVNYVDELYEQFAYHAIKASNDLAIERGAYPLFEGSDWNTGEYFELRDYNTEAWLELKESVMTKGVRNGYLSAVAPNASTAQIAGTTPSIDPSFGVEYFEEKKDGRKTILAPDLNFETYEYYEKDSFHVDQFASIAQNAKRQRHIDQAISFNMYVPSDIPFKTLRKMHFMAWNEDIKTIYYTRSNDIDIEECTWCQS